ncbi:MAG: DNA-directed RNA polymerase subunit beta', partial [bacterium]|nr:DNA-directed RNA polymerase subunit beta' [bacterium]
CDKCGVEVTRSIVRRERMGHIGLASPVAHIWFVRGVPSKIGTLLDLSVQDLERVIYFAGYVVSSVDIAERDRLLKQLETEFTAKVKVSRQDGKSDKDLEAIRGVRDQHRDDLRRLRPMTILSEMAFRDLSFKYGQVFEAGTGAEALRKIASSVDLGALEKELEKDIDRTASVAQRKRSLKRLRLVKNFIRAGIRPEWMFLTVIPVMPPDLRPMVPLDGGRYATSDVNDLYRRVINRNNRLKKLLELKAPEVIVRNEKRMLQEAVDALIDNSASSKQGNQAQAAGQRRALKSLADMLKGKQGRFRQNLLGKRVDYSGRSVIVVGPQLKLHQCGLPKKMALELFKPFVINKLIEREIVHNIRAASRLIEQEVTEVWAILEEVIKDKCVLLNRAPTLHRLGIQAFQPVLIEGLAIEIHPLVCAAFNADFDGDQMAVHLPISDNAQREAREIILSAKNLLKPATGEPIVTPTQDMVLGCYWLTRIIEGARGEGKIFTSPEEAILAQQTGSVSLQAKVTVRLTPRSAATEAAPTDETEEKPKRKSKKSQTADVAEIQTAEAVLVETSVGRILFNEILPPEVPFINGVMNRGELRKLSEDILKRCGVTRSADILDRIKNLGFQHAAKSGITWSMDDLRIPQEKAAFMKEAEGQVLKVRQQYEEGLLTTLERRSRVIEIWTRTRKEIAACVPKALNPAGPVFAIFDSKSRGSWEQTSQMSGMKGLVVNPASEIIELPIKSSYKEGFTVLEYFISTHGARKGASDTALRTATAGYLTRRLVDVAQDMVIREADCGDAVGIVLRRDDPAMGDSATLAQRIFGRVALEDVLHPQDGNQLAIKGVLIDLDAAKNIDAASVATVRVRSVMHCKTKFGLCQMCYGYDLGHNRLVEIGEAVGIVTAQAIGEPGTQLTMRTFHTGGVAAVADITVGLPRVEEIFEVRPPKGKAAISECDGTVIDIVESEKDWTIKVMPEVASQDAKSPETGDLHEHDPLHDAAPKRGRGAKAAKKADAAALASGAAPVPQIKEYVIGKGTVLWVKKGKRVAKGEQLSEGNLDLKELYRISGRERVHKYIIKEVQSIYTSQGTGIHDKHIELVIRKLFSRVRIKDAGETQLLPGMIMEYDVFREENEKARKAGKATAVGVRLLMGITKASLTSDSFLAAASFQETAKVLIAAASEGKTDYLRGLKENVIIGKLIPAGTGLRGIPMASAVE